MEGAVAGPPLWLLADRCQKTWVMYNSTMTTIGTPSRYAMMPFMGLSLGCCDRTLGGGVGSLEGVGGLPVGWAFKRCGGESGANRVGGNGYGNGANQGEMLG